jgi:hypothetical protein
VRDARVAIYYAPSADDPLSERAATWLGRNALYDAPAALQPPIDGIADVTADPRSYGFHATLKPPMRLHPGTDWSSFVAAVRATAAKLKPFPLPRLAVSDISGFLALRETEPSASLQTLSDACVEQLDAFRSPPSGEELARRRKSPLTPEQDGMLVRWGYPYVFGTWFFHMTLTRRLSADEKAVFMPAAIDWFAGALRQPRTVHDICLFTQRAPGSHFTIADRIRLG